MRLIDADALHLDISKEASHCLEIGTETGVSWATGLETARLFVRNAPTIEAEPVKHGRWEMRGGKRYCTNCGERACVTRDSEDFWYTVGTPYCPNCGAKMDGE